MRTDRQLAGDAAESAVANRLTAAGWSILARQVHAGRAELDIVAIDPGPPRELVIVEVRSRSSRAFGLAEETLAFRKRLHLRIAIGRLLQDGLPSRVPIPRLPLRVDLVVVEPGRKATEPAVVRHHRAVAL